MIIEHVSHMDPNLILPTYYPDHTYYSTKYNLIYKKKINLIITKKPFYKLERK